MYGFLFVCLFVWTQEVVPGQHTVLHLGKVIDCTPGTESFSHVPDLQLPLPPDCNTLLMPEATGSSPQSRCIIAYLLCTLVNKQLSLEGGFILELCLVSTDWYLM